MTRPKSPAHERAIAQRNSLSPNGCRGRAAQTLSRDQQRIYCSHVLALRNRVIGGFVALVGLIFTVVGVGLVATANWKTADGTVVSCQARFVGSGGSRHTQQDCVMTWEDGGATHSATVSFGASNSMYPGTHRTIQVHGNSAEDPSPMWVRVGTLVLGLVLLITGLVIALRGRSRRHRDRLEDPQGDLRSPVQPA